VNELKVVYEAMGIDVWEVINSAKTKPFSFMPLQARTGGHCIPIDPFYLTWKARQFDMATRFIELAGEINTSMPVCRQQSREAECAVQISERIGSIDSGHRVKQMWTTTANLPTTY
jgi:UDP-N-acetyl-D-mannosaminuronate dehydrogenase